MRLQFGQTQSTHFFIHAGELPKISRPFTSTISEGGRKRKGGRKGKGGRGREGRRGREGGRGGRGRARREAGGR